MNDSPEDYINQFFIQDSKEVDGFLRKSVLLQLTRDLQFNLGIGRSGWMLIDMDETGEKIKKQMLPLLTPVLLFCSSIDLLARIKLHRIPGTSESGEVFKSILTNYFTFSPTESEIFWKFRCSLSHQYAIPKNVVLQRAGSQKIIEKVTGRDYWFIYVHAMYTTLKHVTTKIFEEISLLEGQDKIEVAKFIKEHGFIMQRIGSEEKQS